MTQNLRPITSAARTLGMARAMQDAIRYWRAIPGAEAMALDHMLRPQGIEDGMGEVVRWLEGHVEGLIEASDVSAIHSPDTLDA